MIFDHLTPTYWLSLALVAAPIAVALLGTLVIRLIARAAERRVAAKRLARMTWEVAVYGQSYLVIDLLPRASLRPFAAWIAWAFVAGMAAALLAQRAVGS